MGIGVVVVLLLLPLKPHDLKMAAVALAFTAPFQAGRRSREERQKMSAS